jgi:hypothetical protein
VADIDRSGGGGRRHAEEARHRSTDDHETERGRGRSRGLELGRAWNRAIERGRSRGAEETAQIMKEVGRLSSEGKEAFFSKASGARDRPASEAAATVRRGLAESFPESSERRERLGEAIVRANGGEAGGLSRGELASEADRAIDTFGTFVAAGVLGRQRQMDRVERVRDFGPFAATTAPRESPVVETAPAVVETAPAGVDSSSPFTAPAGSTPAPQARASMPIPLARAAEPHRTPESGAASREPAALKSGEAPPATPAPPPPASRGSLAEAVASARAAALSLAAEAARATAPARDAAPGLVRTPGGWVEGQIAASEHKQSTLTQEADEDHSLHVLRDGGNLLSLGGDMALERWIAEMKAHIREIGASAPAWDGQSDRMLLDLPVPRGLGRPAAPLIAYGKVHDVTVIIRELEWAAFP